MVPVSDGGAGLTEPAVKRRRFLLCFTVVAVWLASEGSYGVIADGPLHQFGPYVPVFAALGLGLCIGFTPGMVSASFRAVPGAAVFIVWSWLSVFWSLAPSVTVAWQIRSLIWITLFVIVVPLLDLRERLLCIALGLAIGLLLSSRMALRREPFARLVDGDLNGAWISRNLLGHAAALFLVATLMVFAVDGRLRRPVPICIGVALCANALWLLVESRSKAAFFVFPIIAVVVAVAGPALVVRRRSAVPPSNRRLAYVSVVSAGLVLGLAIATLAVVPRIRSALWENRTLTLRTGFWNAAWPSIRSQLSTGYGFGNTLMESDRADGIRLAAGRSLAHLHNGFLDALAAGGVISGGALLWLTGQAIRRGWARLRVGDPFAGITGLVLVSVVTVLNVTEPDYSLLLTPTFCALVALAAPMSSLVRRAPSPPMGQGTADPASPRLRRTGRVAGRLISERPFALRLDRTALIVAAGLAVVLTGARVSSAFDSRNRVGAFATCGPLDGSPGRLARALGAPDGASLVTLIRSLPTATGDDLALLRVRDGRPGRYDGFSARALRLQCGVIDGPTEVQESLSRQILARNPRNRLYNSQIVQLATEVKTRPELLEKFTVGGRLSARVALEWAVALPEGDPAIVALTPGNEFYHAMLLTFGPARQWWVEVLP